MYRFSLFFLTLFFVSCATPMKEVATYKTHYKPSNHKVIAVMDFENLTSNPNAGRDMASFCYNELMRQIHQKKLEVAGQVRFQLKDEFETRTTMRQYQWKDHTVIETYGIEQVAEVFDCDLLLLGTVSEYHYKRGLGEDPVVSIHLRMYDVESKTIMWSGSQSHVGRFSWFKEDALGRLGIQVSRDLLDSFNKQLHKRLEIKPKRKESKKRYKFRSAS